MDVFEELYQLYQRYYCHTISLRLMDDEDKMPQIVLIASPRTQPLYIGRTNRYS